MKALLQEPLLHFLVLGAAFFIAYDLLAAPDSNAATGEIVVTAGQIESLAAGFTRTWQRPPTDGELDGLVDGWVRDEIATREAMALGLDKDDTVIRRRLRQKLEFVSDDIAVQAEPTDADLNAYLQAHAESFRVEPLFTFGQIYLDPLKRGDSLGRDSVQLLATLNQVGGHADAATLGDSFLLERTFESMPASEISKRFGEAFVAALEQLSPGQWQGPIESGYGAHLVLLSKRTEGRMPALADVRDSVHREWSNARRLEANEQFYRELSKRYTVTIERREQAQAKGIAARAS